MNSGRRTETIEVDGRRLAYRMLGEGPALLLLNGYAASGEDWDPQLLAILARSYQVISPDNRGVGGSQLGDSQEPLTIDTMAGDAEVLLDALGVEQAPVVGWSMGGFIAQRLTARAPGRVDALALLATDPGGTASVPAEPRVWALLTDHSGTPREQAARLISILYPPAVAPEMDRRFGELVAEARARLSAVALRAQEAAMDTWHSESPPPPPAADSPPVLVAHGEEDVVIPVANADALAAHWPNCRVERFTRGGHGFMAQEPERLAHLVASFLQGSAV